MQEYTCVCFGTTFWGICPMVLSLQRWTDSLMKCSMFGLPFSRSSLPNLHRVARFSNVKSAPKEGSTLPGDRLCHRASKLQFGLPWINGALWIEGTSALVPNRVWALGWDSQRNWRHWPMAWSTRQGSCHLIPKDNGASPPELRPITILSVVYRVWASTRFETVLHWQEFWFPSEPWGCRPARSAETLAIDTALRLEGHMPNHSSAACPTTSPSALTKYQSIFCLYRRGAYLALLARVVPALFSRPMESWRAVR